MVKAYPRWAFELWALGCGDDICARDYDLPIKPVRRVFWRVRSWLLMLLFGWWWWTK